MKPNHLSNKPGRILFIALLAFLIVSELCTSCNQSDESKNTSIQAFDKAKWPCFTLDKKALTDYFDGTTGVIKGYKKVLLFVAIDDYNNPTSSLRLFRASAKDHAEYAEKYKETSIPASKNTKDSTRAIEGLLLANSEIPVEQLKPFIFDEAGKWKADLDHLLLTPINSNRNRGYLGFKIEARKKDGTIIAPTKVEAAEFGPEDEESNPCPPGKPSGF